MLEGCSPHGVIDLHGHGYDGIWHHDREGCEAHKRTWHFVQHLYSRSIYKETCSNALLHIVDV